MKLLDRPLLRFLLMNFHVPVYLQQSAFKDLGIILTDLLAPIDVGSHPSPRVSGL